MSETTPYDITIIGAGPVGLFGCFYAGLRGMRTLLTDALPEFGGQLVALYPEKYVYDMPGFPRVLARDLAASMAEQAMRFHPAVRLGEQIRVLEQERDGSYILHTEKGAYPTKTVVVCTGAGAFEPRRLDVPGMQEWEGKGVSFFVRDRSAFDDKRVLIVGGGDSALDWAMALEPIAHSITLIHRSDRFRAHERSLSWLHEGSRVVTRTFHEVRALTGTDRLEGATIFDNRTGEETLLEIDACLLTIGFKANLGPIKDWGIHMRGQHLLVNSRMETNLPGVYAAGDGCTYDGKLKLIATGVGEVCVAVNHAQAYIDPSAKVAPGHSSDRDLEPQPIELFPRSAPRPG